MVRSNRGASAALAAAITCALWPAAAFGQAETMAIEHFERGLAQMKSGDYARGCPALRESLRLAPRAGTLFTVAECEARWGKPASALGHYDEYLSQFGKMNAAEQRKQHERAAIARKQLADLKRTMPHVIVRTEASLPGDVTVMIDDLEIGAASLGQPLPVDPGKHEVKVRGAGLSFVKDVQVDASQTVEVVVPRRAPEPPPAPPAAIARQSIDPADTRELVAVPALVLPAASSRTTVAWVLAGGGALATLGGLTLGAIALTNKSTIDAHCPNHVCDAEGKAAATRAQTFGLVSTVVTTVGIAATGAATVLWLTAPKRTTESARLSARPTASMGSHEALVGLEGTFQ